MSFLDMLLPSDPQARAAELAALEELRATASPCDCDRCCTDPACCPHEAWCPALGTDAEA